jgi:predicted enzyme related to lactoylglutathione lyase
MKKVTGIGGIFFKCKNPELVKEWYSKNLGIKTDEYGSAFEWIQADGMQKGFTQWSLFDDTTTYFQPSSKEVMINYRVENIEALVNELKLDGITVLDEIETLEYGKFVHILNPENNKIELWEPADAEFEKIASAITK